MQYRRNLTHTGISLTESLICIAIISYIMLIITHQYINFKRQVNNTTQTLAQNTELLNTFSILRRSIQATGFTPCGNIQQLISYDHRNNTTLKAIDIPVYTELQLNHMGFDFVKVLSVLTATQLQLSHAIDTHITNILIADCYHAEVHTVHSIQHNEIVLNHALRYTYHAPIYLGEWIEEHFLIKKSTLYYKLHHTDILSTAIKNLNFKLTGAIVTLTLYLDNAEPIIAKIRMRNA